MDIPASPRVVVVGGASGMGRWLAIRLFARAGCRVTLADTNPDTPAVAASLGLEGAHLTYDSSGPRGVDFAHFDVVALSVPVSVMVETVRAVAPRVRPGALAFDVTSVKVEVVAALLQAAPAGASVASIHPLFGPAVPSLAGQHVALIIPSGRCDPAWAGWLEDLLRRDGAVVAPTTPEEHDDFMAVTQVLVHFVSLGLAATLSALDHDRSVRFDLARAWGFKTPPYESLMSVLGRILAGDPALYADIQRRATLPGVRERFIEETRKLLDVVNGGAPGQLEQAIAEVARGFGRPNYERAMQVSQAMVQALGQERQRLLASKGRVVGFASVQDAGSVHLGRLVDVDLVHGTATIEERTQRLPDGHVVVYDDASERAAARRGLNPRAKSVSLVLARNRVMSQEEVDAWRAGRLSHTRADLSLWLPPDSTAEAVAAVLPRLVPEILSAEVVDTFAPAGDSTRRKATLRLTVVGDREPRAAVEAAMAALGPLGFHAVGQTAPANRTHGSAGNG